MYFYILDSTHPATTRVAEKLKRELSKYGIAGEVTLASPASPTERLVEAGLIKGYTTLVAVGPDAHINAVAHQLLHKEVAFGFIPIDSPSLYRGTLGIQSWQEAIPILRNRHIEEVAIGETDEGQIFLDRVTINNQSGHMLRVALPQLTAEIMSHQLTILNGGVHGPRQNKLFLEAIDATQDGFSLFKLFGRQTDTNQHFTRLQSNTLAVMGDPDLPVRLDGTTKLTLPLVVRIHPKALRIVVARANPDLAPARVVKKAELLA